MDSIANQPDPAVISGIKVYSYESRKIRLEKTVSYILGLTCSTAGKLHLELEPGWKLKQSGPAIKPPIRWIQSFERNASFDFECIVHNDPLMQYMPGKDVQPTQRPKQESYVFFGNYSKNPQCIPQGGD